MSEEFRTALGRTEDRIFERLESRFERLEAKFDLRIDASDRAIQNEIAEARRDLGELRDLVTQHGRRIDHMETTSGAQMKSSAEGAAKGAGEAAGAVASAAAARERADRPKPFLRTWAGAVLAACSAFTALVVALGQIPNIVKWAGVILNFLGGLATK